MILASATSLVVPTMTMVVASYSVIFIPISHFRLLCFFLFLACRINRYREVNFRGSEPYCNN